MTFQEFVSNLEAKIINSYEQGVTLEEAERLAGEFLGAQLRVSAELKNKDLDSRLKKSGLKAIKAKVYIDTAKLETKLTEAGKSAIVDTDVNVLEAQDGLDEAEVSRDELERYYNIFKESHIHFRGISKGRFD